MRNLGDPQDVLDVVRRLEGELAEVRARATNPLVRELDRLRADLVEDAAVERRRVVEDLERVVALVGDAWRNTSQRLDAMQAELLATRAAIDDLGHQLRTAHVEVRFGGAPTSNGHVPYVTGHASPYPVRSADLG